MILYSGESEEVDSASNSSSDNTLEDASYHSPHRRDSLTSPGGDYNGTARSIFFPHHLISGCSTAESIMCQYSRAITSHEVQRRVGIKGTSKLGWRGERAPTTQLWTLNCIISRSQLFLPSTRTRHAETISTALG